MSAIISFLALTLNYFSPDLCYPSSLHVHQGGKTKSQRGRR